MAVKPVAPTRMICVVAPTRMICEVAPTRMIRAAGARAVAAVIAAAAVAALLPALTASVAWAQASPPYASGQLVVGYSPPIASVVADVRTAGAMTVGGAPVVSDPGVQVLTLPRGRSVLAAAARIRTLPGITYAVPEYLAHAAAETGSSPWFPNDPGRAGVPGGWQKLQWNFLAASGVNAPVAWANLIHDHRAGARGVVIAVLDTGIAYRKWKTFDRSPDFGGTRFVSPCDLVAGGIKHGKCTDPYALDRNGHGTFVAGMIAEATNNRIGLTGLAYGASIMPVRVLDSSGLGEPTTIAEGIRYAVQHGAQVINLSLQFYLGVTAHDIPEIISAINYAHAHRVIVVASAGNDGAEQLAYPAKAASVVSVGATTIDRCLAAYSDAGSGLDLVAPGGGDDAAEPDDVDCHPERLLPDVYQETFTTVNRPDKFGLPGGWYGTSMSAPEVSAAAAMVIASGVIGRRPTPEQILTRLEETAQPLGGAVPNRDYGYGLLDIGAATTPGPPAPPASPPPTSPPPT